MATRGRPRKNGTQPPWMFGRRMLAIHSYRTARSSGDKHSCAVTEAVAAVKKTWPGMRISETEVKRILAECQPKGAQLAFKVTKNSQSPPHLTPEVRKVLGIPDLSRMKNRFTFGFGPRRKYCHVNAKIQEKCSPFKDM